jgi:hypothetical protein
MSIAETTGAYLTGRFAGKLAGKVEAQGEAQKKIFEIEEDLTEARNAIKLWQKQQIKDRATYVELAATAAIHMADFEGLSEVSGTIRVEATALANYLVEHGSISGEELVRLAPVTIERRLPPEQRVLGRRIRRQGFIDFVANNQEIKENGRDIWQGISFTPEERERILGRIAEYVEKYL